MQREVVRRVAYFTLPLKKWRFVQCTCPMKIPMGTLCGIPVREEAPAAVGRHIRALSQIQIDKSTHSKKVLPSYVSLMTQMNVDPLGLASMLTDLR